MRLLRDGGGIYVNGAENKTWPSSMHHNYVNGDMAVFAVFYLDNGASFWWVHDNVATASPAAWAYFMTGGAGLPAKNNRMEALWYTKADVLPPNNQCAQWNVSGGGESMFMPQLLASLAPPFLSRRSPPSQ